MESPEVVGVQVTAAAPGAMPERKITAHPTPAEREAAQKLAISCLWVTENRSRATLCTEHPQVPLQPLEASGL
jgi:hypothetical protein